MSSWQETIHDLCFGSGAPLNPKQIDRDLHMQSGYLWDLTRRDRADVLAAFNAMLRQSEALPAPLRVFVASRIFDEITRGTRYGFFHLQSASGEADALRLLHKSGKLVARLGECIESLAKIEADGRIDHRDAADIDKFMESSQQAIDSLASLQAELRARAMQRAEDHGVPKR